MASGLTRRSIAYRSTAAVVLGLTYQVQAQRRPNSNPAPPSPKPTCGDAYKTFARHQDDFDFEPYWNSTLFKQGAELVAAATRHLDLCNLRRPTSPSSIPAWS